jgi:predicted acylesterase/phospholipase RssA
MSKLGLALSGGGFRATLYHLGVIRFLRDAQILANTSEIASVSGGSILAAHLVLNWDRYIGDDESFDAAATEILEFVRFDIRNHIARRIPLQLPLRLLARTPFLERRTITQNAILEQYYKKYLFGEKCLYELPEQPNLNILATNISTGRLAVFNRQGLFMESRDKENVKHFDFVPGQLARIAQVVTASSAFPGFFSPVEFTAADLGVHEGEFAPEFFTDGGVYDNLGIRAFSWLKQNKPNFDRVIVSDAGKPFQILATASLGLVGQSVRASDILWDRVWQLEHENFANEEGFVFLSMTDIVDLAEDPNALHPLVQSEVHTIRTDLDRFSDAEIDVLVQHGYEVARNTCRKQGLVGKAKIPDGPPWSPVKTDKLKVDNQILPSKMQPSVTARLSRLLRRSSARRIVSTFLDWRDWPSYLYIFAAFLVFVLTPLQVYQLYKKSEIQSVVIDAIKFGDPDISRILSLATSNPVSNWAGEEIRQKSEPSLVNLDGVEILSHSRIYDLRNWQPDEDDPKHRGQVYIRDRISMKLTESYNGDGVVVFTAPMVAPDVSFRQSEHSFRGTITRIAQPIEYEGQPRTVYQFEYNLSRVPKGEAVSVDVELITEFPTTVRAPFKTHTKTDLISVWMLFPADRPYKTYSLVSYPVDRSAPPALMSSRYQIDHPYGTFIGWSVINPNPNLIYETRWTVE